MLYTRFGVPIKITAYCGKHQPKYLSASCCLVKIEGISDAYSSYLFTPFLRADGGYHEIESAIDASPEVTLSKDELKNAFRIAE